MSFKQKKRNIIILRCNNSVSKRLYLLDKKREQTIYIKKSCFREGLGFRLFNAVVNSGL